MAAVPVWRCVAAIGHGGGAGHLRVGGRAAHLLLGWELGSRVLCSPCCCPPCACMLPVCCSEFVAWAWEQIFEYIL